jgi:hypothetical protein
MMKPWQIPINKTPSQGGTKKRRNKDREDPSGSSKDKTQSGSQRGKGTNHVAEPPLEILKS